MTRRRFYPLLCSAFLIACAVLTWIAFAHLSDRRLLQSDPQSDLNLAGAQGPTRPLALVSLSRALLPSPVFASAAKGEIPTYALSADSAEELTEEIELNGLAVEAGLTLTPTQLRRFAEVTSLYQSVRQAYELEIASPGHSTTGKPILEIPLYAAAGDVLRAGFYSALRDGLGEFVAGTILNKIGAQLETRFAGFRIAEQTIELADTSPSANSDDAVITRSVVYWNSQAHTDRPLARRESRFRLGRRGESSGFGWPRSLRRPPTRSRVIFVGDTSARVPR